MTLVSINPSNNEEIKSYREYSLKDIEKVLDKTFLDQQYWAKTDLTFRLECIQEIICILKEKKKEFSRLISLEMGKPFEQAKAEIEKCISLCEYYYISSPKFLEERIISDSNKKHFITFQPLGIILGIMPWNFPFWQVFRFAIPTVIIGNGVIIKHASNVQGCAMEIEATFQNAGFPKHIFCNIPISRDKVKYIIKNPKISALSITGSTSTGRSVAKLSGSLLKKTVLELGGNDPYLILDDADLNKAVQSCIDGRILNTGQSCISAKRIIITKKIYDLFIQKLQNQLSKKIMGDPMDKVDIGPMVSVEARNRVHEQVLRSIELGASLIIGGEIPNITGAFYPITLLGNVHPGMPAFDEEIFGPIFALVVAQDENHAIKLCNHSQFGLGSAVFTKDFDKGEYIARTKLQAGLCFVNDFVKSDPRLPFGGIKDSGYGRELSMFGMMEFANIKTVSMSYD